MLLDIHGDSGVVGTRSSAGAQAPVEVSTGFMVATTQESVRIRPVPGILPTVAQTNRSTTVVWNALAMGWRNR
jgi:hypothetical protein